MIEFSYKNFGRVGRLVKKGIKGIEEDPTRLIVPTITATPAVGLGLANLAVNRDRRKKDRELRRAQIEATDRLVEALNASKSFGKNEEVKKKAKLLRRTYKKHIADDQVPPAINQVTNKVLKGEDMVSFKKKEFSILGSTIKGASIGGTLGMGAVPVIFRKKEIKIGKETIGKGFEKSTIGLAAGTILGAALGFLAGGIKEASKFINRARTVDNRLMPKIIEDLKKGGFKEGKDYTRDPKAANGLKTRVCIVVTKYSDDLRILINTVSDQKLAQITKETIKNIPNSSVVNEKLTDKYNDITISTISDDSADSALVSNIAERFIRNGYPVYLVEVG